MIGVSTDENYYRRPLFLIGNMWTFKHKTRKLYIWVIDESDMLIMW